jgi:hypothetical protein
MIVGLLLFFWLWRCAGGGRDLWRRQSGGGGGGAGRKTPSAGHAAVNGAPAIDEPPPNANL